MALIKIKNPAKNFYAELSFETIILKLLMKIDDFSSKLSRFNKKAIVLVRKLDKFLIKDLRFKSGNQATLVAERLRIVL